MAKVGDMLNIMNEIAPPELAEDWDNPGLLVGRADADVECMLLCVDATGAVVAEARELGAQLIISHHPLMFRATKHVRDDEPEGHVICELIRADMSLIAAHTNLDMAPGGVNDALAEAVGLTDAYAPAPLIRAGGLTGTLEDIARRVERALDTRALYYGPADAWIERAALCSGAGGSELMDAARCGAQLFITGELKHSEIILARQLGLCAICAGHFETERVVLSHLARGLQTRLDALQYKAKVFVSRAHPLM
ncbi:MAG TPA: Nif3-like dinuclear metal center hexameric protein [Candidatus Fimadaptatus faecigallinarum]|uniref:GTP cyclohydrolase 1 type 2 homolog n=1 Tax=Candidatus Fimadaptatus faecigallinarum TaxID=2840814 RepID=A0A9D1S4R1_9FIRM|nr:Nif3-like dinuclear metal center hexameric protein [Candidatus Fimadaptatus faecigallinarum]